ncbi:hypothetical protein AJ79_05619 [Helicocarpus griseus UAMH5409]|uniref:BTB domain-containing protein n=1 Tax=Helicocarpus griseus UAMH5409 TaxID=1447875 RepID=A0A2B7XLI0_9EURO|nr:hypothetical protein AJ79_05619 [Helicocarpus griseus UAMH5409]
MAFAPPGIANLLISKKYSDCKIACRGEVFHAHKVIICTGSPVIAAALDGSFSEATSGTMCLDEFDITTVKRLLQYLYAGNYADRSFEGDLISPPTGFDITAVARSSVKIHLRMHAIGNYLDIPGLKSLSTDKLRAMFSYRWSAPEFIDWLNELISSGTTDKLYEELAQLAATHTSELLGMESFKSLNLPTVFTSGIT